MLKKMILFTTVALPLSFTPLYAMDIEEGFSGVFQKTPGIKMLKKTIGGVEGYEIEKFPEEEKNRNHWDTRGENSIKYLVMH